MEKENRALPQVVSVSVNASSSRDSGHYFWHYRGLINSPGIGHPNFCAVIGPEETGESWFKEFFSRRARQEAFKVGIFFLGRYRLAALRQEIRKAVNSGCTGCQMYEGTLADLVCCLYLAKEFPTTPFFFNFFFAREWTSLLEGKPWFCRLLRYVLERAPRNLHLLADTPVLAKFLEQHLGQPFRTYPLYSPFSFPPNRTQAQRSTDVLAVIKTRADLEFFLALISFLPRKSARSICAFGPSDLFLDAKVKNEFQKVHVGIQMSPLEESDYVEMFANSRVVLLMYLKDYYEKGSSGKLIEAAAAGCRVMVSENSGLQSQLAELEQVSFRTFLPTNVERSARMLEEFCELTQEVTPLKRDVRFLLDELFLPVRGDVNREQGVLSRDIAWWPAIPVWVILFSVALFVRGVTPHRFSVGLKKTFDDLYLGFRRPWRLARDRD